jgi:hypothetical protein
LPLHFSHLNQRTTRLAQNGCPAAETVCLQGEEPHGALPAFVLVLVLDSLVTVIPNAVRDLERAVNAK